MRALSRPALRLDSYDPMYIYISVERGGGGRGREREGAAREREGGGGADHHRIRGGMPSQNQYGHM